MKLYKDYYFLDATKQPNLIYPISNSRIKNCYDRWGVSEISGEISDELRQTVNSISVSDVWSNQWCFPYPYITPISYPETTTTSKQYYVTTTSEPSWSRSILLQLRDSIETEPMIPVYLPSNIKPYGIKKVIFHDPATIVLWEDGTKTVVKCQEGDTYSKEIGLAMCMAKKFMGNKGNFNEVFKKYCEEKSED